MNFFILRLVFSHYRLPHDIENERPRKNEKQEIVSHILFWLVISKRIARLSQ